MGIFNPKENLKALKETFSIEDDNANENGLINTGNKILGKNFLDEVGININSQVAPSSITFHEDYIKNGDVFQRALYLSEYPTQVVIGWLQSIYQYQEALDISFFVQPLNKEAITKVLKSKIAQEQAQFYQDLDEGAAHNFEREKRIEDSLALQASLEREETKPFQVSLIIMIKAKSKEQLDVITDAIERSLSGIQTNVRRASRRQKDGLLSTLPIGKNYLQDAYSTRNMQTDAVQTMFPLTSSDISHDAGVLYGVNMSTHSNIIINRFRLKNPNMIVLGQSGAGKSFTAKMEMIRWLMLGIPITVIDPQNEYQRMCEYLGGQFISISVNSSYKINPLDFSFSVTPGKDVITEKIQNVNKLLSSMVSEGMQENVAIGLNAEQRAIIDETLLQLYANYGYLNYDPETQQSATPDKMPLFSDLHNLLTEKIQNGGPREEAQIQPIVSVLRRYIGNGTLAGLFDKHTNVDLHSNLIVFNVQGLNKDLVGVGMHGILEFVRSTMLTHEQQISGRKRLLYIDEAHRLMKFGESASFIEDMAKTVRKFNIGLTVLTQDPEDFLKARDGSVRPEGVNVVRNCAMQILLSQHKNGIPVIEEVFDLTESEADYLMQADKGEGMLLAEEDHAWISMRDMASPLEYELITTNPEEVAIIEQQKQQALGNTPNKGLPKPPEAPPKGIPDKTSATPQNINTPPLNTPSGDINEDSITTFDAPIVPKEKQNNTPEIIKDNKPKPQVEVTKIKEADDIDSYKLPDDLF